MSQEKYKIAILVNAAANAGRAGKLWSKIRLEVLKELNAYPSEIIYTPEDDLPNILKREIQNDTRFFISAGGDGSLNYLINSLMCYPVETRKEIVLGCIGLGSSNDSLKPFNSMFKGVPVRLDPKNAVKTDLGYLAINNGQNGKRYFINNASLGVTANANDLFNKTDFIIRWTKKKFTDVAIIYAAVKTILRHKNHSIKICHEHGEIETKMSSLSIIKTPYLAGILKYDQAIERNDGKLGLNLCDNMNKRQLIQTVYSLSKSSFTGRPKCISLYSKKMTIECKSTMALEMDGEVFYGDHFNIEVVPSMINFINN